MNQYNRFGHFKILTLFFLLCYLRKSLAANYCDSKLCGPNVKHIGCNNAGKFGTACSKDAKLINLTQEQKKMFLHLHNSKRNQVASGKLSGFSKAKKMPVVVWDDELAQLAELNVRSCKMEHDKCHNTAAFRYSGQNLAWKASKPNYPDVTAAIKGGVNGWFNEYKDADMSYINRFRMHDKGKVIGHFTAMVTDRTTKIGCGMSRYTDSKGWKSILIACNYAFTNMIGQPIYEAGKTCSACARGCSSTYKGLCNP